MDQIGGQFDILRPSQSGESPMKTVRCFAFLLLIIPVGFSAYAQDSENPPVLKLDRIPSLPAFAGQTRAPAAAPSTYKVETVVGGLSLPWALAFLPDGGMIINENSTGTMRVLDADGNLSAPLTGLPEISHEGWSGLFDVAIDPAFEENHLVYFSYTVASGNPDAPASPRVARGELNPGNLSLDNVEIILEGIGQQEIHFAPDGKLLVAGAGGGGLGGAQDMSTYSGKMLRVNTDGSTPSDNPWVDVPGVPGELYTVGHRDISGYATHPETGDVWITEHGPRGGDELNLIKAGANYGWQVISYGTNYSGEPVGDGGTRKDGMEQPRYFWRPSIAPSGLMFYTGDMFPEWQGNVFVTSLSGQHFTRLVLDDDRVVGEERFLVDRGQRIRELKQGPDGALYALTNEEGDAPRGTAELLRISK
jgi:glucose/arabinose dehydrogenase